MLQNAVDMFYFLSIPTFLHICIYATATSLIMEIYIFIVLYLSYR